MFMRMGFYWTSGYAIAAQIMDIWNVLGMLISTSVHGMKRHAGMQHPRDIWIVCDMPMRMGAHGMLGHVMPRQRMAGCAVYNTHASMDALWMRVFVRSQQRVDT
jgi:hypothetical protein